MKIAYVGKSFRPATRDVIDQANDILEEYERQGFDLTLRQLYYQFVARALIPNRQSEYSKLGSIVNDARLAGLIDWDHITDRTRNLRTLAHWETPADLIRAGAAQFRIDRWDRQPVRCEVWVEKDALVGVIGQVCDTLDVPYFSCRGYTSQSEMWAAAQRLRKYLNAGQDVHVFHLGDHDPSGIDMTRDIEERLMTFLTVDHWRDEGAPDQTDAMWAGMTDWASEHFQLTRLALHMDQIEQYEPPPNPAKMTDSRFAGYAAEYGNQSWELDALEPSVLAALIRGAVEDVRDEDQWNEAQDVEVGHRNMLKLAGQHWPDVATFLTTDN